MGKLFEFFGGKKSQKSPRIREFKGLRKILHVWTELCNIQPSRYHHIKNLV